MSQERMPKFAVGDVVRIADPDGYYSEFARKVRDRDALVLENILNFDIDAHRVFLGRVRVEFQKRGARGRVFEVVRNESEFVAATDPHRAKKEVAA